MAYTTDELVEIRNKLIRIGSYEHDGPGRRPHCVQDLIRFATDRSIPGFEDPRSMADHILRGLNAGRGVVECWREGCDYSAYYDSRSTTAEDVTGECSVDTMCTAEAWENNPDLVHERSIVVSSSEQIGFVCVRAECDFNCGYTFTSRGKFGSCQKQQDS